jgi:Bacterial Ig-like domain (group 2)
MGGLLTRLFVGSSGFRRPDNLDSGDVHRLITLDTPHFGSNFANLLVGLHRVNPAKTESTVTGITGGSIVNGAVCDLSENSPALQGIGSTGLKAQVITATGGPPGTPANPALYWGGATFFGIKSFESALTERYCTNWIINPVSGMPVCTNFAFHFPQATVDAFRFREMNDAVVPLSSEQGGLSGINFTEYIHFHIPGIPGVQRGITDGANVATQAFQILDGPDSGLAAAIPAVQSNGSGGPRTVPGRGTPLDQQDYANQCGPGGPMKPMSLRGLFGLERKGDPKGINIPAVVDPRVNLTSPAAGTIFTPGDTINMVVELTAPLMVSNTVGATLVNLTHLPATWTSGLSFSGSFVIPPAITGALTIAPDFTDTDGNTFTGAPVTVGIRPSGTPDSIALQQHDFLVAPDAAQQQLYVDGTYSDGSVLDLTSSFTGTTYTSSNQSVVTVNGDGLVQIVGQGFVSITAQNGTLKDFATFVIEDPAAPLPPADLTSQVSISRSGFRLDRKTGFFVQDLTITNTSTTPLPAVLHLVFANLTNGVTLVNKTGLTEALTPVGSSYLTLPLPGSGLTLPPGGSAQFTLQFLNPDRSPINYSLTLYRTSVAP